MQKLFILNGDITELEVDVIVNAANDSLLGGGGVDAAIHEAAGPQLLAECKTLNGCETGESKITKAYNLPAKYVIHTVGPIWYGGNKGKHEKLESCYRNSIKLALKHNAKTISFPLISSGAFGYPHRLAFEIAFKTLSEYQNDIEIYLMIYEKYWFDIFKELIDLWKATNSI